MKDRIAEIMKREHLTPSMFAEKTGIQRAALSHILNERNKPSLDVVMKIHQAYNYVNLEWLLYGTGEMLSKNTSVEEYQPSLFDENPVNPPVSPVSSEYRKEIEVKTPEIPIKEVVRQEVKYIEKPSRKITEIRIFFDDNTYEIFKPEK